jgi:hypothetical protein|tara:strand:+ start:32 stop:469 length:438 start_codon:yes stop_codon:yes gene_type:complete
VIRLKVPRIYRIILYVALATSWVSGIAFFVFRNWVRIEGAFGPQHHPWQFSILSIHGGAGFAMMLLFGAFCAAHFPLGWRSKRIRGWGIALVSIIALQVITAYCLYYLAHEMSREVIGYVHLVTGVLLPLLLFFHILYGRRSSPQ